MSYNINDILKDFDDSDFISVSLKIFSSGIFPKTKAEFMKSYYSEDFMTIGDCILKFGGSKILKLSYKENKEQTMNILEDFIK